MTARRHALLLALLLLVPWTSSGCGLSSCEEGTEPALPAGGPGTPEAMSSGERAWALAVLSLVNEQRTFYGIAPLVWDEDAARAAYDHSRDMHERDFLASVDPDGRSPGDRLRAHGVEVLNCGENVAKDFPSPAAVVEAWWAASSYRANLLDARFTHTGVGVHASPEGGPWWTADLYR